MFLTNFLFFGFRAFISKYYSLYNNIIDSEEEGRYSGHSNADTRHATGFLSVDCLP